MENVTAKETSFEMVAKTFQGLEEVLAQELLGIGARNVEIGNRMVSFEGDMELMYKANLCTRTALRILKPIVKFTAEDTDELYDRVRDIDWSRYLGPETTFSVDATVNGSKFTHSKYAVYRVKDGIVDYFVDKTGHRPSVRLEAADRMLNVHISDNRVTISLDSSGEPLSKRGYKVENTEAPINEVLAAGIIMMTGWRGDVDFMDPMCGSGTFLVEAALIAGNIYPGIYRRGFAFEKWADFDEELFESIYNDDSQEKDITCRITGSDKDPEAVRIAQATIKNARLDNVIAVECIPMSEVQPMTDNGVLVMNPPYGRRLRPGDMDSLWSRIGSDLKANFAGWHAWIIGMTDEQFAEIGFKPSVKIPLHNGALDCSLREYVIFAGSYDDFRAGGRSVRSSRNDEMPEGVSRGRHLSDKEWDNETRRYGSSHKGGPRRMREERDSRKDYRKDGRDLRRDGKDFRKGGKGFRKDRDAFPHDDRDFRRESREDKEFHGGHREDREFRKGNKDYRDSGSSKQGFERHDRPERKGAPFERKGSQFERRGSKPEQKGTYSERRGSQGGQHGSVREQKLFRPTDKGPKLENYTETRFGTGKMRSRRRPEFSSDEPEQQD